MVDRREVPQLHGLVPLKIPLTPHRREHLGLLHGVDTQIRFQGERARVLEMEQFGRSWLVGVRYKF